MLPASETTKTIPAAKRPAQCIETPTTLRVRAKELTTVRVKVRGAGKGAVVGVAGPGVARTAKTDASGVATLRVRPTRSETS